MAFDMAKLAAAALSKAAAASAAKKASLKRKARSVASEDAPVADFCPDRLAQARAKLFKKASDGKLAAANLPGTIPLTMKQRTLMNKMGGSMSRIFGMWPTHKDRGAAMDAEIAAYDEFKLRNGVGRASGALSHVSDCLAYICWCVFLSLSLPVSLSLSLSVCGTVCVCAGLWVYACLYVSLHVHVLLSFCTFSS